MMGGGGGGGGGHTHDTVSAHVVMWSIQQHGDMYVVPPMGAT